jgi:hypothetical protein
MCRRSFAIESSAENRGLARGTARRKRHGGRSLYVVARASLCLLALLLFADPSPLAQQSQQPGIQGRLIDRVMGEPIGGALVTLVDEGGREWRSAVTADDGAFVLRAPAPGSYRIRVERLGYRVWTSPALSVEAGEARAATFSVPVEPIPIPGLGVTGSSECPEPADVRARGYALYQEARAGLQAVVEGETGHGYLFVMQLVREQLDSAAKRRGRRFILHDTVDVVVPRSIASLSPEELAQAGYVRNHPGAVAYYYAPVPEVLLSDEFLATHCLGVTENEDERLMGLMFTPMPGREVPDVEGVLWLGGSDRELRRLEFHYTGLREFLRRYRLPLLRESIRQRAGGYVGVGISQIQLRKNDFGGVLEFEQLEDGGWITRRWEIRMGYLVTSEMWGRGRVDVLPFAQVLTHTGTVVGVAQQAADTSAVRR